MAKAIVIGTGIAGIASAIRLTLKGYCVEIFEANAYPGGKLSEITIGEFRFDAGPSLLTMPQYVDELFLLAGKAPGDYFNYKRLDLICRYFYEDGTQINAWADTEKFAEEIAAKTADTKESVKKFLKKSAAIYDITNHIFLKRSLHRVSSYLNFKTVNSILRFPQIDPFRTMNEANESQFKDNKTLRFFNRYATYNGSNPYQAPATLNIIPHLEQNFGAYFPSKGMYSITKSLVTLAEELGVKFHYNSRVQEIAVKGKKAVGVKVNGNFVSGDAVVSNMDIWFTYKKLLKDQVSPERILKQERSSSALIFYWAIKKEFRVLDLHNIFFSENYKEELDSIWKEKEIYTDPTVYLNVSSKYKKEDAPPGSENWFVMINVPSNSGQDWDKLISKARQSIQQKLSRILKEDIRSLIIGEAVLDPEGIELKTSSYAGSIYGTSSNSCFSAFLRHANYSSRIKGLYFVGGSVHPGGGIPLALQSARIVSEMIS